MSDVEELKPAEVTEEVAPVEGVEKPAETASAEADKKVQFTPEQQAVFNHEIGVRVAKLRELERERDELKSKVEASAPKQLQKVEVPAVPDQLMLSPEEYQKKMSEWESAMRKSVEVEQENKKILAQQQAQQQELLKKQQEEFETKRTTYMSRAKALGVAETELQSSAQTLAQYGLNGELAALIFEDEDGPLLTKYLAQNPLEVEALSSLPAMKAAVRLATIVKANASALKPKPSSAPDPLDLPKGGPNAGLEKSSSGHKVTIFY
jgi:hypothetical protein